MLTFQPTSPVDDFIAYLNAEIRVSGNWAQDERDTEDGGMLEEVWWSPDDLEAQVHLQLKWAADDALESIVADSDGGGDWQPVVLNLLRRADQRAREADRALQGMTKTELKRSSRCAARPFLHPRARKKPILKSSRHPFKMK